MKSDANLVVNPYFETWDSSVDLDIEGMIEFIHKFEKSCSSNSDPSINEIGKHYLNLTDKIEKFYKST